MGNFHPLVVVGRGSEAQLQVGENLKYLTERFKGWFVCALLHSHIYFLRGNHFKRGE